MNLKNRIPSLIFSFFFLAIMFLSVLDAINGRNRSDHRFHEVGSEENPFIIDSVESLIAFSTDVNNGNDYFGKTIRLTADIDMDGIPWTPIGVCEGNNYFCGVFDGDGHVIKNLTAIDSTMTEDVGFFGMLGGTVTNLGIEGGVFQGNCVGVISVGASNVEARIVNCYVRGVTINAVRAGGIVDNFDGSITRCVSDSCILNGQITGDISSYFVFQSFKDNYSTGIPHPIYSVVASDCELISQDCLNSTEFANKLNHDNIFKASVPGTNWLGYNMWIIDPDGRLVLGEKYEGSIGTDWTAHTKVISIISFAVILSMLFFMIVRKELKCSRGLAVILFANAVGELLIPSELLPPCVWWGIVIEFLAALFILREKNKIVKYNYRTLCISLCFLSALSVFRIPSSPLEDLDHLADYFGLFAAKLISGWTAIATTPLMILSTYIFISCLMDNIVRNISDHADTESGKKEIILCKTAITIVSFVFLLSSYPGSWLGDDVHHVLINQAKCGWWNDWFPLGYSLFVYIFAGTSGNGFVVNIVQTLIWILIQYYIVDLISDNRRSLLLYSALSVIVFTPYLYLEITVKDTLFAMGMLLFSASVYAVLRSADRNSDGKTGEIGRKDYIAGCCGGMMLSLFRHGGFIILLLSAVVIIGIMVICKDSKYNKKLLFPTAIILTSVVAYFIVNVMIFNALGAKPNPKYVKYTTPIQMISAAADADVEFRPEDQRSIEKAMSLENWKGLYNKFWSDAVARSWSNPNVDNFEVLIENEGWGKDLLSINLWIVLNHPVTYFKSLADIDSMVWEISEPADLKECLVTNDELNDPDIIRSGYGNITAKAEAFVKSTPVISDIYFRGGFWLLIICILFGKAIKSGKQFAWATMIPLMINEGLLLLAIPTQDTRFILPLIEIAVFIVAVYLQDLSKEHSHGVKTDQTDEC